MIAFSSPPGGVASPMFRPFSPGGVGSDGSEMYVTENEASSSRVSGKDPMALQQELRDLERYPKDAIPPRTLVLARFLSDENYRKAKIKEVRYKAGYGANSVNGPQCYQYYVEYIGEEQRMDTWLTAEQILPFAHMTDSIHIDQEEIHEDDAHHHKHKRRHHHRHKRKHHLHHRRKSAPGASPSARTQSFVASREPSMQIGGLPTDKEPTVKTVSRIQFGKYLVDAWYPSPFPPEYTNPDPVPRKYSHRNSANTSQQRDHTNTSRHDRVHSPCAYSDASAEVDDAHPGTAIYFCEFCLNFYRFPSELDWHLRHTCRLRHPPGDEVYRHEDLSMFEVDGSLAPVYCQNLCYLAKLFIKSKRQDTVHEVEQFLFFVLCEYEEGAGYHFVGYFSRQKESPHDYNVACILTLPQHQRKGYGKFLIQFSYELSLIEKKTGGPERPLSDLGAASYHAYWKQTLLGVLAKWEKKTVSIQELMDATAIQSRDIQDMLSMTGLLVEGQPGEHWLSVHISQDKLERINKECGRPGVPVVREKVEWTPYNKEPYGPRSERLFVNGPTIERATVMGLKRSLTAPARPDAISQSAPVAEIINRAADDSEVQPAQNWVEHVNAAEDDEEHERGHGHGQGQGQGQEHGGGNMPMPPPVEQDLDQQMGQTGGGEQEGDEEDDDMQVEEEEEEMEEREEEHEMEEEEEEGEDVEEDDYDEGDDEEQQDDD